MIQYTVQSGDSLYSIARRFQTSLQAVLLANPRMTDSQLIYPGMVLNIPVPQASIPYTVQPGDSLFAIARRFGISYSTLLAANPGIVDPSRILPGMTISIPRIPGAGVVYEIVGSSPSLSPAQLESLQRWRRYAAELARAYPQDIRINGPTQLNAVSLTFDDGPDAVITPAILDVLRRYEVKAAFFFIGSKLNQFPEVVRRTFREGHLVLSHGWSHRNFTQETPEGVRNQILLTEAAIESLTGRKPSLLRPPYGAVDAGILPVIRNTGNKTILWSLDSMDWSGAGKAVITANAVNLSRPGEIILLHSIEGMTAVVDALPDIITGLRTRGYRIIALDEMLGLNAYK